MSTVLSDADQDTLQDKVAKLVTDQHAADAADDANTAAQATLAQAQAAATAASAKLDVANAAVIADEHDLEAFVEGLVAANNPAPAPAPTPAPSSDPGS